MTPLFVLPFDHRASLARELLGAEGHLTGKQRKQLAELKLIVYNGFLAARKRYTGDGALAILVDEEFGAPVISKARKAGIPFALTMEASGKPSFTFDRSDWRSRLTTVRPTFAKALVHYVPGDETHNALSRVRLRQLSNYCAAHGIDFMLEVLTGDQTGKKKEEAMRTAITEFLADGVRPTLWKIEGLSEAAAWKRLGKIARAPMVILGRGAAKAQVAAWITAAARSGKVTGFAIGRTIFLHPLQQYIKKAYTKHQAEAAIAKNFLAFTTLWHNTNR